MFYMWCSTLPSCPAQNGLNMLVYVHSQDKSSNSYTFHPQVEPDYLNMWEKGNLNVGLKIKALYSSPC